MDAEVSEILYDLKALQQIGYFSVVVLAVGLYDYAQNFAKEVDLVWRGPFSPISLLYIMNWYLGITVLAGSTIISVCHAMSVQLCYNLLEFEAWGTLVNVWIVQGIMQLRIFAMYHQSRKVGTLLVLCSLAEAAATVVILWLNLGPNSSFTGTSIVVNANRICASTGMRDRFMVMTFVPVVCFEFLLVALVVRVSVRNVSEMIHLGGTMQANSLTRVLARDSLVYFLINLALMLVVIALWVALPDVYGRVPAPLIDVVLYITGSRLVLSLRTRRARVGHQVDNKEMGTGIPLHVLNIRGSGPS